MEELENEKAAKIIRGLSLYLLSGATVFSLEVIVYADKGWKEGLAWWGTRFLGIGVWLMAPYAGLSALVVKLKHTLRQEIVLLFGSLGVVIFGISMFFEGFFVHNDPRSWILYVLVPIYQWIAVAGAAALRYSIGRKPN
ncbi:MAG TPA: hypothetical protein VEM32_04155 [Geobacteraceae bacterium]|nr:hypothetical protein [Geobacteraceae bacterium]